MYFKIRSYFDFMLMIIRLHNCKEIIDEVVITLRDEESDDFYTSSIQN